MNYKRHLKNSKKPTISFFCPAYNDEKNLPILIPKVNKLLKQVSSNYEIVIIDDASPDNSGIVADMLAKKYPSIIRVVHHKTNRGYGGAIQSGLRHARKYDYIFYTDGDNQYDVNELKNMLRFIPKYDAVLGYRTNRSITAARKIQSTLYNALIRSIFRLNYRDVGCALRLVRKDSISKMPLRAKSAFVQVEIILELKKQRANIKQIPVKHFARLHGKASGGKPTVILGTIADIGKAISSNR